ncbi:MAG: hypothetical protein AOA65_0647 [Candidatus Bathyarchaeota archaeon BA1]|nr:MAG: hypothetical protein AOA65_0647 [Candidatus Bathyarchaeota archaeon BA1]
MIQSYLENTRLQKLLEELKAPNIEVLIEEIGHFTEKEAEKRDQIVLGYFGEGGVNRIVDSIVGCLLSPPRLRKGAEVLDVGAGSGLFTLRVVDKLRPHLPRASFYAMDVTPGMLQALSSKTSEIVPFLGVGENIAGSVEHARKYFRVPKKFDAVFSTLMLHHCPEVEKVFGSVRDALKAGGKAVFIDLCKHPFKEFMEMGDVHLGFQPDWIETMAKKHFSEVHVERMPGICCECSGRSAELFLALVMP